MGMSPAELARRDTYQALCTSCGACCMYYAREEGDINADGPAAEDPALSYDKQIVQITRWQNAPTETSEATIRVMKTTSLKGMPACIALRGTPGEDVGCSIYEVRPEHCGRFMPGSNMCIRARRWAGYE